MGFLPPEPGPVRRDHELQRLDQLRPARRLRRDRGRRANGRRASSTPIAELLERRCRRRRPEPEPGAQTTVSRAYGSAVLDAVVELVGRRRPGRGRRGCSARRCSRRRRPSATAPDRATQPPPLEPPVMSQLIRIGAGLPMAGIERRRKAELAAVHALAVERVVGRGIAERRVDAGRGAPLKTIPRAADPLLRVLPPRLATVTRRSRDETSPQKVIAAEHPGAVRVLPLRGRLQASWRPTRRMAPSRCGRQGRTPSWRRTAAQGPGLVDAMPGGPHEAARSVSVDRGGRADVVDVPRGEEDLAVGAIGGRLTCLDPLGDRAAPARRRLGRAERPERNRRSHALRRSSSRGSRRSLRTSNGAAPAPAPARREQRAPTRRERQADRPARERTPRPETSTRLQRRQRRRSAPVGGFRLVT